MPIPKTRSELLEQLETSFAKLRDEVQKGGSRLGSAHCVDDWTVKELLAVRAWWTENVVKWVSEGRRWSIAKDNVSATVGEQLRAKGHDVLSIRESIRGGADKTICRWRRQKSESS